MSESLEAPRPPWRDEYLHDLPALQQYAKRHLAENLKWIRPKLADAASTSRETKFKVRDVRRLVEAARAAGLNPTAVEVDVKGCIRVISGKSEDDGGDLDKWVKEHPS